jgi:zinc transport system permease protein
MSEILKVFLEHKFMQNAVLAGVLASVAFGLTGTFVYIKRIAGISGGIAHAILGGVGIAYYLQISPFFGAFAFAILSAFALGFVKLKARAHEDTMIAALWSIGMALGIVFMSLSPGYQVDLLTYLFGNILMISKTSLWLLLGLDVFIVAVVVVFFRQFVFICFDEEYARLRGIKVNTVYVLLLCLISLSIVILIQVVGLILVIALLTLPAAIASLFVSSIGKIMAFAVGLGFVFTQAGLVFSYYSNLPAGATIIIITGIGYLIALAVKKVLHRIRVENNRKKSG